MGRIDKKVQNKFEKVFKNVPKDIPLQYEMGTILKLMQEMYELGFADGYADGFTTLEVKKMNLKNYKCLIIMNNESMNNENTTNENMIIDCYDCHEVINFTEDDVIDGWCVKCPCCGEKVSIL